MRFLETRRRCSPLGRALVAEKKTKERKKKLKNKIRMTERSKKKEKEKLDGVTLLVNRIIVFALFRSGCNLHELGGRRE